MITEYVEGNRVPHDIRAAISENNDEWLRQVSDYFLFSKLKGLACVCCLSQPDEVFHFPKHRYRNLMTQKIDNVLREVMTFNNCCRVNTEIGGMKQFPYQLHYIGLDNVCRVAWCKDVFSQRKATGGIRRGDVALSLLSRC